MALNIQSLQERVAGEVITPDHAGYDAARQAWNLTTDQHPALILIAADVPEIIAGVNYAREVGLGVGVQLTGHGHQQPIDDALMIVTRNLRSVSVDPHAQTAAVGAGVQWADVVRAAAPHGLAPLLGSAPHVGVVGYTLGGGLGWLTRKFGLAADSVRWIELVTPDGVLRRVSPLEEGELFWGLLGGGGNFGVVTALEFDLHPVTTLYGGGLMYPGELAAGALRFYREWVNTLPDEMTSSIRVMNLPNLPVVPEALRGKVLVMVQAAFAGTAADGAPLMQPWLDWHAPLQNLFREMPFSEVGTISNDPVEPSAGYGSNETLDHLSDAVIDLIVKHMTAAGTPLIATELRHAGGAVARAAADRNAVGNRDAQFFMQMSGAAPTPERYAAVKHAIDDFKTDLRPHVRGGVFLNFMKGEEAAQRTADAYTPEMLRRLRALKAKVDPNNLFRFSYQLVAHG